MYRNGRLEYAEASERYYQSKFSINQAPDEYSHVKRLLANIPDTDLVLAKTWSSDANALLTSEHQKLDERRKREPLIEALYNQFSSACRDFLIPNIAVAGHTLKRLAPGFGKKVLQEASYDHHTCHAAFAVHASGMENAAVAIVDGLGEQTGLSFFKYNDGRLTKIPRAPYSGDLVEICASLGLYYGILVCVACGFEALNGEEWKVMGLAPYGSIDRNLLELLSSSYSVDGLTINWTSSALGNLLNILSNRVSAKDDFQRCANRAYTFQWHYSELISQLLANLREITQVDNLVLAGGCGLNSSYNGKIAEKTGFRSVFIPSAPGDDGTAAGAAILAAQEHGEYERVVGHTETAYLGSEVDTKTLDLIVAENPEIAHRKYKNESDLVGGIAKALATGAVVGWMQGRAEFGPRALGNRSILADPRNPAMKDIVNRVVKFRESFRPFAPAILHEAGPDYFEHYTFSPYMERTLTIKPDKRALIPAVCHADHTGRLQSVTPDTNPRFYRLIEAFNALTGVPILLNTSLNVMGKPIVHTVEDAISVFLTSKLDVLVVGNTAVFKSGRNWVA